MSQWSLPSHSNTASPPDSRQRASLHASNQPLQPPPKPPDAPPAEDGIHPPAQPPRPSSRSGSRPSSMVQNFHPPLMDVNYDTPKELQPIFSFLNSHSSKLYHEGYFLKLHDLDSRGSQLPDRRWQECFAQLVGTVLSVWDAAELDVAGDDGEVKPAFINLADASIKMIQSLPMQENGVSPLANVLSVSTAASNRYLFHFNSFNSLTQWTAAIRLAMFEHTSLQEAYTGSLIAGKGKSLNNIRIIMERSRVKHEDWARVRFGAGNPWRRCWFVVSPPDEKEYQKMQKTMKKQNPYDKMPVLKGDLKFYESKKITKKTKPIATITEAFSAYAIYPQSKPLIDQSTLVKIEGRITIHAESESTTEGFVFVMPEIHPAISGFEMMLRFLFPVWDAFALYGRPNRLVADSRDTRGLMFALPKDRRYGYLEGLDVATLIHSNQSPSWAERDWRKQMKDLTAKRMLAVADGDGQGGRAALSRSSLPIRQDSKLRFEDSPSGRSTPGFSEPHRRTERDPVHRRSASEAIAYGESPPAPPPHQDQNFNLHSEHRNEVDHRNEEYRSEMEHRNEVETGSSSSKESGERTPDRPIPPDVQSPPPGPVGPPPTMSHQPYQRPTPRPPPRAANPDLDRATLSQLEEVAQRPGQYRNQAYPPNGQGAYQEQGSWNYENEHPTSMMQQHYQQSQPQSRSRYPPPRLATIPASPYVEQMPSAASDSSKTYFPQSEPPIQEMATPTPPHAEAPNHGQATQAISRKPVGPSGANGPPASGDGQSSRPGTAGGGTGSPASARSASSLGGSSTVANVNGNSGSVASGMAGTPTSHPHTAPPQRPVEMRAPPPPSLEFVQHEQAGSVAPLGPTSAPDPLPHPIPMNLGTQQLNRKPAPAAHGPPHRSQVVGNAFTPPPLPRHGGNRGPAMGQDPSGGMMIGGGLGPQPQLRQGVPGPMPYAFEGQGPPMQGPPMQSTHMPRPPMREGPPQGMPPPQGMMPPHGILPQEMPYGMAGLPQGMTDLPPGKMVPLPGMNVPPGGMMFSPAYHPVPGGRGPPSYVMPPHPTTYGVPRNMGPPMGPPPVGPPHPPDRSMTPPGHPPPMQRESTTPPGNPPPGVPVPPRHGTPLDFTKAMQFSAVQPQQAPVHRSPGHQSPVHQYPVHQSPVHQSPDAQLLSHQPSVRITPLKQSPVQQSPLQSPPPQPLQDHQQQGEGPQVLYGGQLLPYEDVMQMKKRDARMYGPQYVDTMERMTPASLFRGGAASPPAGEAVKRSGSGKKWF